jgi:hypothetical protein
MEWNLTKKKTELTVVYKANQKHKQWEMDANRWSMRWHDKTIQFNKGDTRLAGILPLNWHAHIYTCAQRVMEKDFYIVEGIGIELIPIIFLIFHNVRYRENQCLIYPEFLPTRLQHKSTL